MDYTIIEVPELNDSMSSIILNGTPYYIRFTYNDTADCWKFGLYDSLKEPILQGVKVVPNFPLDIFYPTLPLPDGTFIALTNEDRIGRYDFRDGVAQFVFVPIDYTDPDLGA